MRIARQSVSQSGTLPLLGPGVTSGSPHFLLVEKPSTVHSKKRFSFVISPYSAFHLKYKGGELNM